MKKYILFLIVILMSACSTYSVVKQTSIKEIQFGYGGGVTQSITRYTLKPDGKLYRGQEIIKKVAKDDVLHIYEKAASLDCNEINSPSNTFSVINIIQNDTSLYYCWNIITPFPLMTLDKELNNLLPK